MGILEQHRRWLIGRWPSVAMPRRHYRSLHARFDEEFELLGLETLPGRRAVLLHRLGSTALEMASVSPQCRWDSARHAGVAADVLMLLARALLVLSTVERARAEEAGAEPRVRMPGIEHSASHLLDQLCSEHDPARRAQLLSTVADVVGTARVESWPDSGVASTPTRQRVRILFESLAASERRRLEPEPTVGPRANLHSPLVPLEGRVVTGDGRGNRRPAGPGDGDAGQRASATPAAAADASGVSSPISAPSTVCLVKEPSDGNPTGLPGDSTLSP